MKLYIFITIIISSVLLPKSDPNVNSITYEQCQNKNFVKNLKNNIKINSYETKSHGTIEIGSELIIGNALEGNFKSQENVGLFSANTSQVAVFATIIRGKIAGSALMGMNYLPAGTQSEEVIVVEIKVIKTRAKKDALRKISIFVKNKSDGGSLVSGRTIIDFERSLSIGEIINPNAPLDREQAIDKLKEAKDLLDLEIMTQEEYDAWIASQQILSEKLLTQK